MMNIKEMLDVADSAYYSKAFWDSMRLLHADADSLEMGSVSDTGTYILPSLEDGRFKEIKKEYGEVRSLATEHMHYQGNADILSAANDEYAEFVTEGSSIPGFNVKDDFTGISSDFFKLAAIFKIPSEMVHDATFDIKGYLIKTAGRAFARAEDKAFINGTGTGEPTGLLHATAGAETGVESESITYDDVIKLFFSVKPEYRKKAVWMMNDATALVLRKLKDENGSYLWNQATDTILGKEVIICNEMPDIADGKKPVLFGALSYYWIIDRTPASLKALNELFAINNQVGYLGFECLDAKLICSEAVKVIEIIEEE